MQMRLNFAGYSNEKETFSTKVCSYFESLMENKFKENY